MGILAIVNGISSPEDSHHSHMCVCTLTLVCGSRFMVMLEHDQSETIVQE
jgi:hypothetical protein